MPDEDLRALERAARLRPDDVQAGWALARALGRVGDPREHDALVAVARLGDAPAQEARTVTCRSRHTPATKNGDDLDPLLPHVRNNDDLDPLPPPREERRRPRLAPFPT